MVQVRCFSRGAHSRFDELSSFPGAHDAHRNASWSVSRFTGSERLLTILRRVADSLAASSEQARAAAAKCEKLELEAEELRRAHDAHVKQSKSVATQARRAASVAGAPASRDAFSKQLATKCAELERAERRHRNAQEGVRLGCVALQRVGVSLHEV